MWLLSFSKVIDFLGSGEFFFWGFKIFWKLRIFVSFLRGFFGVNDYFVSSSRVFFRVNGHFLLKTNGSWIKKSISSQKPTVLGQKSSFPLKNRRFWHKKVYFLLKTNSSGTKKFISSQKPTVLAQKSLFPLKNQRFSRKKREKRSRFSVFWEGEECFLQKISNITVSWKNLSLKKGGSQISFFFLTTKNGI